MAHDYKRISLMSDGMSSFSDENQEPIDTIEIVNQATNFKNLAGIFAQRRMKSMLRKLDRASVEHYDDISIASIVKE